MIELIAAVYNNNVLATSDEQLPLHIPEDLRFFKAKTAFKDILMGRTTYESIGRLLPNRRTHVLTSKPLLSTHQDLYYHSNINSVISQLGCNFVIVGGGSIYHQFITLADTIYITRINYTVEKPSKATFPDIPDKYTLVENSPMNVYNGTTFWFEEYRRLR